MVCLNLYMHECVFSVCVHCILYMRIAYMCCIEDSLIFINSGTPTCDGLDDKDVVAAYCNVVVVVMVCVV